MFCHQLGSAAGDLSGGEGERALDPGVDTQGVRQDIIAVPFDPDDCRDCLVRSACTQAKTGPRTRRLRPQEQHEALQTARKRPVTEAFKELYAARSGIEGTWSQGLRAFGLRSARYRGQAKTHLPHILIAMAINLVRVFAWLQEIPRAITRTSAFARLVTSCA